MKVEEIKAYAAQMIELCEKGGQLTPAERTGVVTTAMSVCGRPFDEVEMARVQEARATALGGGYALPIKS